MLRDAQKDFLYWHASTKLNNAAFKDARAIFEVLHQCDRSHLPYIYGWAYCQLRLGLPENLVERLEQAQRLEATAIEKRIGDRLRARCVSLTEALGVGQ